MIKIVNKIDCCGCSACSQICQCNAINMVPDEEGFLYPSVNLELCTNCGLCEKICPFQNPSDIITPIKVDAFINNDKYIHTTSTSGGAFTAIANIILCQGGIVFGVRYDENWQAVYSKVDTHEGLLALRGPKYVQASVGSAYKDCYMELKSGRQVLFCGTPCQISGLKHFLRKDFENLLTVEVICHGVPSPKVWKEYLCSLAGDLKKIKYINLRHKTGDGGNRYYIKSDDVVYYDAPASTSLYSQGFIRDYFLRPSCFNCLAKQGRSHADISLGDCWGIKKIDAGFHNKDGVSTIIYNSTKAIELRNTLIAQGTSIGLDLKFVIKNNSSYKYPAKWPYSRKYFWEHFNLIGIPAISDTIKRDNNIVFKLIRKIKSLI